MAIAEYIEEIHSSDPEKISLLPKDAYGKAIVRAICEHVNAGMQPLQNLRCSRKVHTDYGGDKLEWCRYWNQLGFEQLEKRLEKTAGKFAYGD